MNSIQMMSTQPWVEHLSSTLLHFLWEGLSIAAVYGVGRKWSENRYGSNVRYSMACMALVTMAAAPIVTWILLGPPAPESVAATFMAPLSMEAPLGARSIAPWVSVGALGNGENSLLPWVAVAWLAGTTVLWVRLFGGWILTQRFRRQLVSRASNQWQQVFGQLKTRLQMGRPVQLLISSMVHVPVVVGWLRPAVLVPVGALAGLPSDQVEALLLHELAHIRRHDYLVNVLQNIVEATLFYHPALWWISGHIRVERELCCDDVAVAMSGDVVTYARALAALESARPVNAGMVMASNGGSLASRIARLAGVTRPTPHIVPVAGILVSGVIFAFTALTIFGQATARPNFKVTSIRPASNQDLRMVRPVPGHLTANASLQLLIQYAYGVQSFQIEGGPGWINSESFEIEAKADSNASREQVFLMLQSLLEDRYRLKFHRETRERPVYALVTVRNGIRATSLRGEPCVEPALDAPPDWAGGRMAPPQDGQAPPVRCGTLRVILGKSGAQMQGGRIAMTELARSLSLVMNRTVMDRTGFDGLSDIQLTFLPDDSTAAMPPPPPGLSATLEVKPPSILIALQEQLGLRLESTRAPVEVIVIDHAERPRNK